jgi:hypothetical protein
MHLSIRALPVNTAVMKYAALVVQVVLQAFKEPFYFILSIHGCLLSWSSPKAFPSGEGGSGFAADG